MSQSPIQEPKTTVVKKQRRHSDSWSELWLRHHHPRHPHLKNNQQQALKNMVLKMHALRSVSSSTTPPSESDTEYVSGVGCGAVLPDYTCLLSDQLMLKILSKVPENQHVVNTLVCRRWSRLSGKLVHCIKLLDWEFLESGRLVYRFPNLVDVDIVRGSVRAVRNSGIVLSNRLVMVHLDSGFLGNGFLRKEYFLDVEVVDRGLKVLAEGCGNLRRLVAVNVSEEGLKFVGKECETLQELELHCVNDLALRGIGICRNLQILKVIGSVDGVYDTVITDIGLTILAQGCRRLVKLELVGCEGSFDGIKAVGQCCQMLEELTFCNHRMDDGWLPALSYCENLKTLKLQSCRSIDPNPGPYEHLFTCPTIEELYLQQCQLRDKQGMRALFVVCKSIRELTLDDCWGLDNNTFDAASICRGVRYLSLEGCSSLTTEGFESVVLSWKELRRLRVISCKNIKDSDASPALANLFSVLKELKWRPDSKSLLEASLAETGVGQIGRSFKMN
ncbi:hypothetical protein LIER_04226 [Lithospermum erythrorhizon]|uniref:F-box domain-containing protein n=1 Tax=Lithospermum erythrorhizon TaxID=34254 RepID=A0AAV3NYR8_LITER